jgi:hypothetical protein
LNEPYSSHWLKSNSKEATKPIPLLAISFLPSDI